MSTTLPRLEQAEVSDLPVTIRNAGIAGAGGAGFPTHAKWEHLDSVDSLLVNHQESEPNYFMDKWLGREHADDLAALIDGLLDAGLDRVVITAKLKDRAEWLGPLEAATGGTVYEPGDLPIDDETGVVFAYTADKYEFGMESVLLRLVADTVIGDDLPMDHGWIVQNTETLFDLYRALRDGDAVTHKYVHVDGDVPNHRFLEVPIGTPAAAVLEAAGRVPAELAEDHALVDGGPGWCFEIEAGPHEFGVRKRTNALLVLTRAEIEANTLGQGRINVLNERDWAGGDLEREPTASLEPDYVRVPLISNPAFEGVVARSRPIVDPGEEVERGEMIAVPGEDGISNTQHASITGEVTDVSETHVDIERAGAEENAASTEGLIYWTACEECGRYVTMARTAGKPDPTRFRCQDCR